MNVMQRKKIKKETKIVIQTILDLHSKNMAVLKVKHTHTFWAKHTIHTRLVLTAVPTESIQTDATPRRAFAAVQTIDVLAGVCKQRNKKLMPSLKLEYYAQDLVVPVTDLIMVMLC